jgi:phenylalanyl-tRNA synthetase beta chain
MRTTLLGSLLGVARSNAARGADRLALFESGRVYLPGPSTGPFPGEREAPFREPHRVGCLATAESFFALKGVLEALAGQLGVALSFEAAEEPFLHPGTAASVRVGEEPLGWIGELHPLVARQWDLDRAAAFEIDLAVLISHSDAGREIYEDVTSFPAVYQDLAVVVPAPTPAAAVREAVMAGGGELLRSAEVFDLYEGEQLGQGRKSLALRLEFRAADRTLTDEEVASRREAIEAELEKVGGSLRE